MEFLIGTTQDFPKCAGFLAVFATKKRQRLEIRSIASFLKYGGARNLDGGEWWSHVPYGTWRRGWDLNPRLSFPNTRFPSVLLKPLGHLSVSKKRMFSSVAEACTSAKLRSE